MSNKPKEAKSNYQKSKIMEKARRDLIDETRGRWAADNENLDGKDRGYNIGMHEGFGVLIACVVFPNGRSMSWAFRKKDKWAARSFLGSYPNPSSLSGFGAMTMVGKQVAMYVGDEEVWNELDELEQRSDRCMEHKGTCEECPECVWGDAAVNGKEQGSVH